MKTLPISLRLLRKAIDTADDGLVIAEQEGDDTIIIYANRAFERLTGYSEDEILYRDCRFLQGDDRDQPERHTIREAIRAGRPCRVRLRNYRKDGSLFWNELSITPVRSDEDGLTYYIGIQKDVSGEVDLARRLQEAERRILELEEALDSTRRSANP
jgi:PAS domain S-box-containing protein